MNSEIKKLAIGFEVEPVNDPEDFKKHFAYNEMALIKPNNWILPKDYLPMIDYINNNYEIRSSDVFISSYIRVGTTWTQEIVWNLMHNPNRDNPDIGKGLEVRSPNIELDMWFFPKDVTQLKDAQPEGFKFISKNAKERGLEEYPFLNGSIDVQSPRVIKTHLPFSLLPKSVYEKAKVIYVARDPMDATVSGFHFVRLFNGSAFTGTMDEYCDLAMKGNLILGCQWEHTRDAYVLRDHPNILIIFFEDLKNKTAETYAKIEKFLGTNLTPEQLNGVIDFTSFKAMKDRSAQENAEEAIIYRDFFFNQEVKKETGGFFRKGLSGAGSTEVSEGKLVEMKEWCKRESKNFPDDFRYKIKYHS